MFPVFPGNLQEYKIDITKLQIVSKNTPYQVSNSFEEHALPSFEEHVLLPEYCMSLFPDFSDYDMSYTGVTLGHT